MACEINWKVYDSLNCKGCCSGENSSPPRDKHVYFCKDICNENKTQAAENRTDPVGICACCKDPPCQPLPKECQNFGRPVLVYEIPQPKFEGLSIHQRDFVPKPVSAREMPPWHPILKDRWKPLAVPSLNRTTYQSDFTPQVATEECRKPVYLAPKKKKDRVQELSEDFQTWIKTSKGPSQTHEQCDKPIIVETPVVVCKEVVPCTDQPYQKDPRCADTKQLHGPDCEKNCYSAPLMCHVRSPKSLSDKLYDGYCHDDRKIPDQTSCHNSQFVCVEGDLTPQKAAQHHHHHTGLLDSEVVEVHPSHNESEYTAHHKDLSNAESENKCFKKDGICHRNVTKKRSCHDYARHPLAPACSTMNHPAGDGRERLPSRELQNQDLSAECSQDNPQYFRDKHVHFAPEPEICCNDPIPRNTENRYPVHYEHEAHNLVKSSSQPLRSATKSSAFTLCEDSNKRPEYWWKKTTCEPQRRNIQVENVPQDLSKPFCPSYLTSYKRDYTEPCLDKQSCDRRTLSKDCGCKGSITESFPCAEFERGGLV